jgi:hypothetical protein
MGRRAAAYAVAWASVLAENPSTRTLMLVGAAEGDSAARSASAIADAAGRSNRAVVIFGGEEAGNADAARRAAEAVHTEPAGDVPDGTLALPLSQREPPWDPRSGDAAAGYDLVVTSVPAPSEHPVAMSLAACTDAAIVVATAGRTRLDDARRTAESLRLAGVQLVASILIRPSRGERVESERRRSA